MNDLNSIILEGKINSIKKQENGKEILVELIVQSGYRRQKEYKGTKITTLVLIDGKNIVKSMKDVKQDDKLRILGSLERDAQNKVFVRAETIQFLNKDGNIVCCDAEEDVAEETPTSDD